MLRGEKLMSVREAHWTDTNEEREPRCRDIEEQVERRRKAMRLEDMDLPKGFRLVTPQPKQFWVVNQLVWGFQLAWAKVNKHGERMEEERLHFARYYTSVADEQQMHWAIEDFRRELAKEEVIESLTVKVYTRVRMELHPQRGWHGRHLGFAS